MYMISLITFKNENFQMLSYIDPNYFSKIIYKYLIIMQ